MNIPKTRGMNLQKTNGMNIRKNTKGMNIQTSKGMGIGKKGDYSQFDEYKRIRDYLATKPVSHVTNRKSKKSEPEETPPEVETGAAQQEAEVIRVDSPGEKLFSSSLQSMKRSYRKFTIHT